ncbi:hypothetical protein V2J94_38885 [Streptomyces sp. DSM 41524]|uniref:Secreted protein n=1 Tax=Streptomyces asiaticus subsp. ignotus TaxID=3098222 RepID=A0ABU7Q8Q3_9ACTN|nr:hypothetical protein [Streptomyces sp. DSM 41524]
MRIRYALTGTVLGAALALGAIAAPAQAAPAQPVAQSGTVAADNAASIQGYVFAGQYITEYECGIAGYSQPLPWYCQRYGVVWYLFVKIS